MDVTIPLIFVGLFVIALVSIFLVFKFGITKKSYDEAWAEQKQQANALLATKLKPKEKKSKKAVKKVKEKVTVNRNTESHTVNEPELNPKEELKLHVDFKEEPEHVPLTPEEEVKDIKEIIHKAVDKKRSKKVRPILVNKGDVEPVVPLVNIEISPQSNHFEEILPKDDFQLWKAASKEDISKNEAPIEEKKQPKLEEKKQEKSLKKVKQPKQENQQPKINALEAQPLEQDKEKQEKVVEIPVIQKIQEPINTGKEKKKKKSEVVKTQPTAERDELINSVRKAELSRTEVQMLIDLLLNKQLEAPAVIDEWSEGKSDPVQKLKKQLAEKEKLLDEQQQALAGVHAKLKEVRNEQFAERVQWQQNVKNLKEAKLEIATTHAQLQQKLQEFQELRNEEIINLQNIIEENNALKMQRGQLEVKIISYQESENLIHNLKGENEHLSNELQRLTRELHEQQQGYAMQNNNLQKELNEVKIGQEFTIRKQMDETRNLSDELHRLSKEINSLHKERQDFKDIISKIQEENEQLRNDKEAQINGSTEETKAHEVKILNLSNELSSAKSELSSVILKFQEAEQKYKAELESSSQRASKLNSELEEQKDKNNDLRKKNWKVMEALNAAESRNKQAKDKSADLNIDAISSEIKAKEQASHKEFLLRLFPEVEDLKTVTSKDWQAEFSRLIKKHIVKLQQTESPANTQNVSKLQNQVQHYKKVIDETESMLNNLQLHIEKEERRWRSQLAAKDAELESFKSNCLTQLQNKVTSLENQLSQEQQENRRLVEEHHKMADRPEVKSLHSDATATIERLSEEVDRLKEQLRVELTKNSEANVCQKAQNCNSNSTNGAALTEDGNS